MAIFPCNLETPNIMQWKMDVSVCLLVFVYCWRKKNDISLQLVLFYLLPIEEKGGVMAVINSKLGLLLWITSGNA